MNCPGCAAQDCAECVHLGRIGDRVNRPSKKRLSTTPVTTDVAATIANKSEDIIDATTFLATI
jgi:hypothetical protein